MSFNFNSLNSISNFNKIFSQNMNNFDNAVKGGEGDFGEFGAVFDEVQKKGSKSSHKISGSVQMSVGADAINSQKVENLSDSARMARDIGSAFSNSINSLNSTQKQAEHAVETLASGGDISVHDVMIASQKSGLAMQMSIQMRNQMINAYNEFKNIRI